MSKKHTIDKLKAENDLKSMKVSESKNLVRRIQLETDVAEFFPDSKSVNEALRFLIRITKENITELTHK